MYSVVFMKALRGMDAEPELIGIYLQRAEEKIPDGFF